MVFYQANSMLYCKKFKTMRSLFSFALFCSYMLLSTYGLSTEINFYGDFDIALEIAEEKNMDVFVYVGRGYSESEKKLDSLFQDEEVIDFLDKNYISVKLRDLPDVRFIKAYTRQQYPVLMFFNPAGKKLHEITYCCESYTTEVFLDEALFAASGPLQRKDHLQKNFKKNKNDPALLKELLALSKRYKDQKLTNKVLNRYAEIYRNDSEDEWMEFVLENVSKENSKLFEILLDRKEDLEKEYGVEEIQGLILGVFSKEIKAKLDVMDVDNFISKLVTKVNDHELDIDIENLMLAAANRKYTNQCGNYRIKSGNGEFAYRMLKSDNQIQDQKIFESLVWDIAYHSQNRLHLELALENLNDYMLEIDASNSLVDCRSVLLHKLGEKDDDRLSALLERRAYELKLQNDKDCGNILVYRAKFLRMK